MDSLPLRGDTYLTNSPENVNARTYPGLDIEKNVFQVHGVDRPGEQDGAHRMGNIDR